MSFCTPHGGLRQTQEAMESAADLLVPNEPKTMSEAAEQTTSSLPMFATHTKNSETENSEK